LCPICEKERDLIQAGEDIVNLVGNL